MSKKAFVLLEMMNAMLLVAQEAKSRGYAIVALNHDPLKDSGPFAVPRGLVDELIFVGSWADDAALRALARELTQRYDIVGTFAMFEGTLPTEAALRERVGLPATSVANTVRVLDKAQVRRKLYAEGLSALRSTSLPEALGWDSWRFDGPAVLKPANGTGSALCFTVRSMDELRAAAAEVRAADVINPLMKEYILTRGEFVLEEKADGELLSVESVLCRGDFHCIGLTGRYVLAQNPVVEQGLFFPYHHPRQAEIVARAKALHQSLEIFHGATHLEVMVAKDGPIELIDFNARFAGFASVVSFGEAFGMRFEAVLTDVACGAKPDLSFLSAEVRFAAEMVVLPPPHVTEFRAIAFPAAAIAGRAMKTTGQRLTGRADQLDAVGMFIITGDSAAEAHNKALEARRQTTVNGKPLGDNPNNALLFSEFIGKDLARPFQARAEDKPGEES
jgi:biotin carboxylase